MQMHILGSWLQHFFPTTVGQPASLGWSWTGGAVGAGAEWLRTSQMRLGSCDKVCSICGVPDVHPSVEFAPSNYKPWPDPPRPRLPRLPVLVEAAAGVYSSSEPSVSVSNSNHVNE